MERFFMGPSMPINNLFVSVKKKITFCYLGWGCLYLRKTVRGQTGNPIGEERGELDQERRALAYTTIYSKYIPGLGLSRLQKGERFPGVGSFSTFRSSLCCFISSSLSVALSSVADSLPDCSADVTLSSTLSSDASAWGAASASIEEEEEEDEGGWFSRARLEGASSLSLVPRAPSVETSFCFCSCSFWRLRCFLRNFARRFLNHT